MHLYIIPGNATDWRMHYPQLSEFDGTIIIPEWLPPFSKKETLPQYAKRLLASIELKEPYMLGGVSLGGMLAQEMALLCKPKALVLIATCSDSKAIPLKMRMGGRILNRLPNRIIKIWLRSLSYIMPLALVKDKTERKVYRSMLEELPAELVKWQSGAATRWKLQSQISVPVFHIHGKKDKIILPERVKPTAWINDAGHFANVTHRDEVNNFIKRAITNMISLKDGRIDAANQVNP